MIVPFNQTQVTFLDLIILPLWETWGELVYPDAQEMLDNLSQTRDYWVSQLKCASPPLSENEPDKDDKEPVNEVSVAVPQTKEQCHNNMSESCSESDGKCSISESGETCTLQNSSDFVKFQDSNADERR